MSSKRHWRVQDLTFEVHSEAGGNQEFRLVFFLTLVETVSVCFSPNLAKHTPPESTWEAGRFSCNGGSGGSEMVLESPDNVVSDC